MERLTERDEFGNADIIGVDSADLQLNLDFDAFNRVTEALNRLASYEDLEEQGRLVVLPCKVGDKVYTFYNGKNCKWPTNMKRGKIYETLVSGIRLHDWDADDWRLLLLFDTREASGCYEFSFSEVGKTVFLTRAEAEKAMEVSG